jgi:hypothetical protein
VFSPAEGRFAVELPGPPALERDARLTPVGYVHQTKYWLRAGDALLAVELHDIPAIAAALMTDEGILDRARDGVIENENGTLLEAHALAFQGAPAREFTYRLPGDAPLVERVLVVLVESRLYLLTGMAARAPASHPDIARFFASFRVWKEGETDTRPTP